MASSGPHGDTVGMQEEAVAYEAWFRRSVQAGLDTANAGDTVPAKDVEADAKAWRTEARRKRARSAMPAQPSQ